MSLCIYVPEFILLGHWLVIVSPLKEFFFTDLNTFSINSICEANTEVLIGNTYAQYHSERVLKSYPRVLWKKMT